MSGTLTLRDGDTTRGPGRSEGPVQLTWAGDAPHCPSPTLIQAPPLGRAELSGHGRVGNAPTNANPERQAEEVKLLRVSSLSLSLFLKYTQDTGVWQGRIMPPCSDTVPMSQTPPKLGNSSSCPYLDKKIKV